MRGRSWVVAGLLLAVFAAGCGSTDEPQLVSDPAAASSASITTTTAVDEPVQSGTVVARARNDLVLARAAADDAAAVVAELSNPTPVGSALVFRVLTPAQDVSQEWIEVMLPVRPNGTTGWVRADEMDLSINPFRIEIDTSDHRLDLYEDDTVVVSTDIAVGTGSTPTPYGDFYLAELLEPPDPGGSYGPYAFGLSGYSEVLDSFAGGDGVIGIHGTNEPDALGTDVSHGCVRVLNEVIEMMAERVPLGTPVSIQV